MFLTNDINDSVYFYSELVSVRVTPFSELITHEHPGPLPKRNLGINHPQPSELLCISIGSTYARYVTKLYNVTFKILLNFENLIILLESIVKKQ